MLAGRLVIGHLPLAIFDAVDATKGKGPGIARTMQHLQGTGMEQRAPDHLPFVGASADATRKQELMLVEVFDGAGTRTCAVKRRKEGP